MDENLSRGYCQLYEDPELRTTSRSHSGSRSLSGSSSLQGPWDKCNCVYLSLLLCGAGFLLPYNSFITAVDYYLARYPGSTIIFDMSLTYICMALISVIMNNVFVELLPLQARITFGYVLSFITLLFIAVMDICLKFFSPEVSYSVTLVAVAVVSVGCTVQQSSFYGYTSMLPQRYTQAVMVGESAAGLLVSINRILTKAIMPQNTNLNTLIFFIISIITVFFCCVIFHMTRRSDFVRYHVSLCQSAGVADDQRGLQHSSNPEEVSLVDIMDGHVSRDNYGVLVIQSPTTPPPDLDLNHHGHSVAPPVITDVMIKDSESLMKNQGQAYKRHMTTWQGIKRGCINRYRVSKKVWPYMLSIGLAYFVTLCLFPGVESEVVSCRLRSWMPVLLISFFNFFDFIGKIIASASYDWPRARLVVCTLSRIILVPLLMLCVAPRERPILHGEFWPFILSMLLGITNGYFGSVPMILAPSKVPDEQKELTGNIMTLSYSVGLTIGSAVAYLLDEMLGPHLGNPCMPTNISSFIIPVFNRTHWDNLLPHVPPV